MSDTAAFVVIAVAVLAILAISFGFAALLLWGLSYLGVTTFSWGKAIVLWILIGIVRGILK